MCKDGSIRLAELYIIMGELFVTLLLTILLLICLYLYTGFVTYQWQKTSKLVRSFTKIQAGTKKFTQVTERNTCPQVKRF